jgi:hypothetical protein
MRRREEGERKWEKGREQREKAGTRVSDTNPFSGRRPFLLVQLSLPGLEGQPLFLLLSLQLCDPLLLLPPGLDLLFPLFHLLLSLLLRGLFDGVGNEVELLEGGDGPFPTWAVARGLGLNRVSTRVQEKKEKQIKREYEKVKN